MNRAWGDWTEKEQAFFREWKLRWPWPADWSRAAWESGRSTLADWLLFVGRCYVTTENLARVMDLHMDRDSKAPRLVPFRRLYEQRFPAHEQAGKSESGARGATREEVAKIIQPRFRTRVVFRYAYREKRHERLQAVEC